MFLVPFQKKGLENRSSRFEPKISWLSFSRGSGPPLRWGWVFFKSRLQNDVRRFGRVLAGLFSQQILFNLIQRCSNHHAEIFMDETNMRRFETVFTNRITTSWHQKSKLSKKIVLFENTLYIWVTHISCAWRREQCHTKWSGGNAVGLGSWMFSGRIPPDTHTFEQDFRMLSFWKCEVLTTKNPKYLAHT